MNTLYDAIVIGAGQAGLVSGYYLQQAGLHFLILEAGQAPAGSWPCFYDSMALNSTARYSSLPGLPFPGEPDRYPRRDEVVAYLHAYAAHLKLPVVTGVRVGQVARRGRFFRLRTSQGSYLARTVVAATGFFGRPNIPILPGQARYRGRMMHTADYRRPEPFRGERVVIVGGANGAVQIGMELAQVARVTLATRQSIRFLPQRLLGRDIHFWLQLSRLDRSQWLGNRSAPVYDDGAYRAALAAGRPDRRPLFAGFTEQGVIWSDGFEEAVDTVIWATGYQPNLPYLAGLGELDEGGAIRQRNGVSLTAPGLYYVGLLRQRSAASATLRGVGRDAKEVVAHLQRYVERQRQQAGSPLSRRDELAGWLNLIAFAWREQIAQGRPHPRVLGEALLHAATVGAGSLGVGRGRVLYKG